MQQRQPRLGDILDDYCPRERRLTNHAVVAMIGEDIRLTRCTTCDAEHDYKYARVPRLRKKDDVAGATTPALAVPAPKRIAPEPIPIVNVVVAPATAAAAPAPIEAVAEDAELARISAFLGVEPKAPVLDGVDEDDADDPPPPRIEEGPVHRQLIRAQLPRHDGQPPAARQAPDFTIRQPGGRPNRFRRAGFGGSFNGNGGAPHGGQGNRSQGQGSGRGQGARPGNRPPAGNRAAQRHNGSRKRSK